MRLSDWFGAVSHSDYWFSQQFHLNELNPKLKCHFYIIDQTYPFFTPHLLWTRWHLTTWACDDAVWKKYGNCRRKRKGRAVRVHIKWRKAQEDSAAKCCKMTQLVHNNTINCNSLFFYPFSFSPFSFFHLASCCQYTDTCSAFDSTACSSIMTLWARDLESRSDRITFG